MKRCVKLGAVSTAIATAIASHVFAQGYIESPANNRRETGIGVISGWICTSGKVDIQIDAFPPLTAGSGTERNDTREVCGRADTGYSLLYNYNVLTPGPHVIRALQNGFEFARANIVAFNAGAEFLTGRNYGVDLPHFPEIGKTTRIIWAEEKQGFTVSDIIDFARPTGTEYYYGAIGQQCGTDVPAPELAAPSPATFVVNRPARDKVTVEVRKSDGSTCTLQADVRANDRGGLTSTTLAGSCQPSGQLTLTPERLQVTLGQVGRSSAVIDCGLIFGAQLVGVAATARKF